MTTIDEQIEMMIVHAVDKKAAQLRRPELVTQRNVEAVIGIPKRDFLRLARKGAFPSAKERRLTVARTLDVLRIFEARFIRPTPPTPGPLTGEAAALARVGARRVAK